jgi:hypothetical protein
LDGIENPSNEEYLQAAKKTFLEPQTPYPETDADKLLKTISTMKP